MDLAEKLRRQLLEQSRYIYYDTPISEATSHAYLATPRHLFVSRYREWGSREWHEVRAESLEGHLAALYANRPLVLFGEDDEDIPSTISQPSFVLRMLDLLRLQPGHKVFELGAGSGWNAALMACLVDPGGHVYSVEIIPEVARAAAAAVERLGIRNVSVIAADGGGGYAAAAPYDRAIFTAGTYDLPRPFYGQIAEEGLLLVVIKNEGGGDNLFVLRRARDHFASLESMPCGFVQLKGRYQVGTLEPTLLETLPEWTQLQHQEISRTPFWWGGKGREGAVWRTLGIRSFLGITEPSFRAFKSAKANERARDEHYFGLWVSAERSLVLARDDLLISHGNVRSRPVRTNGLSSERNRSSCGACRQRRVLNQHLTLVSRHMARPFLPWLIFSFLGVVYQDKMAVPRDGNWSLTDRFWQHPDWGADTRSCSR